MLLFQKIKIFIDISRYHQMEEHKQIYLIRRNVCYAVTQSKLAIIT